MACSGSPQGRQQDPAVLPGGKGLSAAPGKTGLKVEREKTGELAADLVNSIWKAAFTSKQNALLTAGLVYIGPQFTFS